jgi:hypothetical protein
MSILMACFACHTFISDEGTGESETEVVSLILFAIGSLIFFSNEHSYLLVVSWNVGFLDQVASV